MAFTPRTIAEIRDALLAYWAAEYAANGEVLLTTPGSDACLLAAMIAVIQNACDVQTVQVARDILPDQASDGAIARFGYVYGIPRGAGVEATCSAQVTGASPATTYPIPAGTRLAWTNGLLYDVLNTSVTTDVSSHATVDLRCTTIGVSGTRAVGDTLTFQSAPAGLNPTATVTASTLDGEDLEPYSDWALRIISRLRDRPASGNRADWRAWVFAYTGTSIVDVYVYPLLQPPDPSPGAGTPGVLGCVTVVAVGPAQGDSTTNTRVVPYNDASGRIPGSLLLRIIDYINGERDAEGNVVANGTQLRPVTMADGDWVVETINTEEIDVEATLTVTSANAFPFSVTPAIANTSTTTSIIVTGNYAAGGIQDLSGLSALVNIGTGNYRGGYYRVTLGTGSYDGGATQTTFPVDTMPAPPVFPGTLNGAPANWDTIRAAVLAYFDELGPSDTTPPSRWPNEDAQGRSTLYLSAFAGLLTAVPGVLSATVTTPATDTAPAAPKTVLTLGTFLVVP